MLGRRKMPRLNDQIATATKSAAATVPAATILLARCVRALLLRINKNSLKQRRAGQDIVKPRIIQGTRPAIRGKLRQELLPRITRALRIRIIAKSRFAQEREKVLIFQRISILRHRQRSCLSSLLAAEPLACGSAAKPSACLGYAS